MTDHVVLDSHYTGLMDDTIRRLYDQIVIDSDRRTLAILERKWALDALMKQWELELLAPMKFEPIADDFRIVQMYRYGYYARH